MRVLIALCLLGAAFADLNSEWTEFKRTHKKSYNAAEEVQRRLIWEQNVRYIQQHNLEADRGHHTYWLGMNEFGDLTEAEVVSRFNGFLMNETRPSDVTFLAPSHTQAPEEVDWRKEGYVTEVKNQLHCGSCWSFSATGALEGQHYKKTGQLVSLSEQNLVDCSKEYGNHGCKGGSMKKAFLYVKNNHGIDTEASYPYMAKDGICHFKPQDVGAEDTGFVSISRGSEEALMQAVAAVGPISVAIDASKRTFHLYKYGVYNEPACSSTKLDHGVLAVGYGTEEHDYWLIKNSWGTSWGTRGFGMMSRNRENQCGIATSASYPTV